MRRSPSIQLIKLNYTAHWLEWYSGHSPYSLTMAACRRYYYSTSIS